MPHDGSGTGWDETAPANADPLKDGAQEIRDLRKALRIRLEKEHVLPATSSAGGEHKEGSAKAYVQSAAPTTRPDGSTALTSADEGRLWVDSDDGNLKYLNSSGTWTQITLPADAPGAVNTADIADGAVTTAKLADRSVTTIKIALLAVTDAELDDDAVITAKILNSAVTTAKINDLAVTSGKINDLAVTTGKINDLAVTSAKLGASSIETAKIADANVTLVKMAANSVDSDQYVDGSIDTAHYAAGSVDATALASDAVIAAKILAGAVTVAKLGAGIGQVKIGTYTGNGTTTNAVVVGFTPDILFIQDSTVLYHVIMGALASTTLGLIGIEQYTTAIQWDVSTGFTIKTANANVNTNGRTYYYLAIKMTV